jgi:hypothetical protein
LGKNAQKFLPLLKETPYFPTILWDNAATDMKPNFEILTDNDILLVFPASPSIWKEIEEKLQSIKSKAICVNCDTIVDYLGSVLFPIFLNYSLCPHTLPLRSP